MIINNPILKGFNPDPSMIFVNGYYYIATSTFEYYPGVQIHRSKDLVNFEVVARPIDFSKADMRGNPESGGIWAPCLSYNDGLFYLIYTDVKIWAKGPFKDCDNYLITAKDVEGKWSEPVYLNSIGFDPSLFHDDDGKKYLVSMEWDYRCEESFFSGILLQEYDEKKKVLKDEVRKIFKGSPHGSVEGPHIYKIDGYYYLFSAEGGTASEHAEVVCRSKNIFGPYEIHPLTHIVTSYKTDNPLQRSGHASLCKGHDGNYYMAHLCGRPVFNKRCVLGRETAIQNIDFIDGWPYIRGGQNQPRQFYEINEDVEIKKAESPQIKFNEKNLRLKFQSLRQDISEYIKVIDEDTISLRGAESIYSKHTQAALLLRQTDIEFEAGAQLSFEPEMFGHIAGLLYRYNEDNQYLLAVSFDEKIGKYATVFSVKNGNFSISEKIGVQGNVNLCLSGNDEKGQFFISDENKNLQKIGQSLDVSILSDEFANPMGFTGAFVGMYCGDFLNRSKCAIFSNFYYKGK